MLGRKHQNENKNRREDLCLLRVDLYSLHLGQEAQFFNRESSKTIILCFLDDPSRGDSQGRYMGLL